MKMLWGATADHSEVEHGVEHVHALVVEQGLQEVAV